MNEKHIITPVQPRFLSFNRYWPTDNGAPMEFDGITVMNTGSKSFRGYVHTTLKAVKGKESMSIHHLWFLTWPDHGIPRTPSGLIYTDDVIGNLRH